MLMGISRSRWKKAKTRARNAERASAKGGERAEPSKDRVAVLPGMVMWLTAILALQAIHGFDLRPATMLQLAGDGFILLVVLAGYGLLTRLIAPHLTVTNSEMVLLFVVSLLSILPTAALMYVARHLPPSAARLGPVIPYLLPLSLAPLLTTILMRGPIGFILGVWVSTAGAVMAGRDFHVLVMGLLVSALSANSGRNVRKRSTVFRIGLMIALAQAIVVASKAIPGLLNAEGQTGLLQLAACFVNGFSVSLVALLAMPAFEALFNITTDITLLEISDLGHPLLQRLALEAPGTYHHSLVAASLAQAAADEIGANSLLARVGAYYHDIGKLTKPDFFSENIQQAPNPHDDLQPSMSTLVIVAHVKEGASLAMLHKLPQPVIDAILQHHGTGIVRYFHHKARKQLELEQAGRKNDVSQISEQDFRYPGPKPATRESAIISIADSVEAASRSIEKANASRLEDVVSEVVNAKLLDGQLDECDLTMEDLGRIKRSLVFTLTVMLHGRIAYPRNEDNGAKQAEGAPGEHAQDGETAP